LSLVSGWRRRSHGWRRHPLRLGASADAVRAFDHALPKPDDTVKVEEELKDPFVLELIGLRTSTPSATSRRRSSNRLEHRLLELAAELVHGLEDLDEDLLGEVFGLVPGGGACGRRGARR
jgi:hypothetical protein